MEELFNKLMCLGYGNKFIVSHEEASLPVTEAHYILEYYEKHGALNGCDVVEQKDRKALDKWYRRDNMLMKDAFGVKGVIACSGVGWYGGPCSG